MALTSTEIKRLLQPMKDFAPAILRCAEIVEAAEQAEVTIKEHATVVKAAQSELADLARQKQEAQDEVVAARAEAEAAKKATADEKVELAATLKTTQAKVKAAQEASQATQNEHANVLAANKQELLGVQIVLEEKKKELADFRRAIPKTY